MTDQPSLLVDDQIGPGLYLDLPNSEYHAGPGVSKSGLDYIAHCPSAYMWAKRAPVDTEKLKALDFGTALHALLLEPEQFDSQFAVAPELNMRTNDGKKQMADFEQVNSEKLIMTADEWRKLQIMRDSVMAHPTAEWIFSQQGINEASIYWQDDYTGELCRVRPDRILTDHNIIVDVKKVADMSRLERHIEEFRYHVQDAMYSDGYKQHFGVEPMFLFLAVSSTVGAGRYAVDVIEIDPDWKQRGHELYRRDLEKYHQCKINDDWMHIKQLKRPAWAVRNDREDS